MGFEVLQAGLDTGYFVFARRARREVPKTYHPKRVLGRCMSIHAAAAIRSLAEIASGEHHAI